jgi:molybdate transport system substrate-binding protein
VTEILYTPGVRLVGTLPEPYALSTTYAVAVSCAAAHPEAARRFFSLLTGPAARPLREAAGFGAA